jgi:transposase InsO family protein
MWLRVDGPAVEVDSSIASRRVTHVWEAIIVERGHPLAIPCDNGSEFTSRHFLSWRVERQVARRSAA